MIALGLPDWVFVGAIALLAVGLPIIMVTGHHERNRAAAVTTGLQVETPTGVRKHFTWRNAIAGGGLAFVGLAIVSTAYMAGRLLGIGPGATLMATGAIGEREPLVLAELDNRTTDPTLGSTVTELLRVSLSQSPVIRLVDPARLSESLGRMQRDPTTTVDESIALEIAEREGIKAVLSGDVVPLGSGYVVSARLVAADGTVLTHCGSGWESRCAPSDGPYRWTSSPQDLWRRFACIPWPRRRRSPATKTAPWICSRKPSPGTPPSRWRTASSGSF
jgi:hypothetical protein